MDTLEKYQEIVQTILQKYTLIPSAYGNVVTELIVSHDRNHFLLMDEGWQGDRRIHDCLVHVQIRDGKIWIQYDGIEDGIGNELVEAGIPREFIVLGFYPLEVRQHTEFAVA